jgi:hypothetical protein
MERHLTSTCACELGGVVSSICIQRLLLRGVTADDLVGLLLLTRAYTIPLSIRARIRARGALLRRPLPQPLDRGDPAVCRQAARRVEIFRKALQL